jgi:DNA-binding NtrC family response regulator
MMDPVRVLLVDDEEIVGKRLEPALTKHGYQIEFCRSGREAVDRIRKTHFDIVVTDIRMDEIDGLGVLATVRKSLPKTPTILITGYARADLAREAQAKGAFDFIAKPFRPSELLAVLDRAAKTLRGPTAGHDDADLATTSS